MTTMTEIDVHARTLFMEFGDDVVHFNIFYAMRHPTEEHFVFLVDIIDDAVDNVDICTNLISDFFDFDLGSFNYACDDSNDFIEVCSICVEISFAIHFNCVAGSSSDSLISLPPTINLPLPSTIQKHLKYAYLDDA